MTKNHLYQGLGLGLQFKNLYNIESLEKLDEEFLLFLKKIDEDLYSYIIKGREKYTQFSSSYGNEPEELIECAKILEIFIADIFNIQQELSNLNEKFVYNSKSFAFKKAFINKKIKSFDISTITHEDFISSKVDLFAMLGVENFDENIYIEKVSKWLGEEEEYSKELHIASIFGAFLFFDRNLYNQYNSPNIFFKAKKVDFNELIEINRVKNSSFSEVFKGDNSNCIKRDDFNLYTSTSLEKSLHNSNYCVKCHKRGRDYCRIGEFLENNEYTKNTLGTDLVGCPLSMHISQMHVLNELASPISALCVATINNPLLAGTGANICNDCSTSCIFQKQETVDTPLVESEILKQVLDLSWGFEIYSLLTRWNPLRFYRPTIKNRIDKNILIVGTGPAGYSLAYNMSAEGYGVVVVDALKIEPLNVGLVGADFEAIINYKDIVENLDNRIIQGFGGVSEYGITSRWDKNYLKVLRIILERNNNLKIYGGIRFGSQVNFNDLESLGFSHVSLCTGAGKPNITKLENSMCKGVKTSSEFLMSLNLGAYKKDNFFNMQIRLPIVVLGGGLTAIDCATESILYYERMVEKNVQRYRSLNPQEVDAVLSEEDKEILEEYLEHYEMFKNSDAIDVINSLGGVKIIYHKAFEDSRAYKTNAVELQKTLRQGVSLIENAKLLKINKDNYNYLNSLDFEINGNIVNFSAKTMIIAIGTNPNNILQEEYKDIFNKKHIQLNTMDSHKFSFKNQEFSVILQKLATAQGDISISILGDTHKIFNGSVVKAMASAFYGQYPIIESMFENTIEKEFSKTIIDFEDNVLANLVSINKITDLIFEVNVKSKLIAEKFQAGQFFKIQNFESLSKTKNGIKLYSEPVILTGMHVDKENHIIKSVVLKSGVSTSILESIPLNEPVLFMGPLGEPTPLTHNKKIVLIGGGLANATVISIACQAKLNNCDVIYVGGYKHIDDIFYLNLIKSNARKVFFSVDSIKENYSIDGIEYIKGNVLSAVEEFKKSSYRKDIDSIIIAGSCSMMGAVKNYLSDDFKGINIIASLNSPMQCGLKGICGSCLQKSENGSFSYTCSKQEVPVKEVNFQHLQERLEQNSLTEKLSYLLYKDLL